MAKKQKRMRCTNRGLVSHMLSLCRGSAISGRRSLGTPTSSTSCRLFTTLKTKKAKYVQVSPKVRRGCSLPDPGRPTCVLPHAQAHRHPQHPMNPQTHDPIVTVTRTSFNPRDGARFKLFCLERAGTGQVHPAENVVKQSELLFGELQAVEEKILGPLGKLRNVCVSVCSPPLASKAPNPSHQQVWSGCGTGPAQPFTLPIGEPTMPVGRCRGR